MSVFKPAHVDGSKHGVSGDRTLLYPQQGQWTEDDYLRLKPHRGVELVDGCVEDLPMPTMKHQLIAAFLFEVLRDFVRSKNLGIVLFAGLRIRMKERNIREPDVVFMAHEHRDRMLNEFWHGADLAMEVVSDDDPKRDLEVKRAEYAKAGIGEYWIIDPRTQQITVLTLPADADNKEYAAAGEYAPGQRAASILLPGFEIDVALAFAAARIE